MSRDPRAAAAITIGRVLAGQSLNQVLPGALDSVSARDRSLTQQLCYGTLRAAPRLQALLALLLDKPLKDKDRDLQGLLLCGLYQLEGMRIPDHASVAATVGATRALKKSWGRGLANAVLRRFQREREPLLAQLDEAAAAAWPAWLYREVLEQWPAQAAGIFAAGNEQPPMTLRVNALRTTREQYRQRLADEGIGASPGALSSEALTLDKPRDVDALPGFAQGDCSVQDEAAQLAALLLDAQPGERVLDACAAPGGKTCHVLERQPALAELVAADSDGARLARVAENLERLALPAQLIENDATSPVTSLAAGSFDRILVDAPCSASGVIRRHPDVKVLRRAADIEGFAGLQGQILDGLWPLLKPGGTLLYATCSILRQENDDVVSAFVAAHGDVTVERLQTAWGETTRCGRQLLPSVDGPDGLFYARLKKHG